MNDRSNQVAEGDADQTGSERKFFCPLTDLVILILVFFGGSVLKFLLPFLGRFSHFLHKFSFFHFLRFLIFLSKKAVKKKKSKNSCFYKTNTEKKPSKD